MTKAILRRPGWWEARSLRERRLLTVAAILLALVLVWLLVIRPLMDARADADARLDQAVADLGKARAEAAARTQQAAPQGQAVPAPLDAFLRQSGSEQGFTNLVVTASGPARAAISSPQVRPPAFFAWIGQLEARGLVVETLSARANADQTIAVDAVLRAGGG